MEREDLEAILQVDNLNGFLGNIDEIISSAAKDSRLFDDQGLQMLMAGKRLRPALLITACQAAGGKVRTSIVQAAAAVEIAHKASLFHDDIIDEHLNRMSQANYLLAGDFLLVLAHGTASAIDAESVRELSQTITTMAQGQAAQLKTGSQIYSINSAYCKVAWQKTGVLFETACTLGAKLGFAELGYQTALAGYGRNFGIAFQINDDLEDGDITKPQVKKAKQALIRHLDIAKKSLSVLPGNQAADGLINLAEYYAATVG
jgi:geranylgeranyl pyrophosphate synthase